jgi:hypothetical protein
MTARDSYRSASGLESDATVGAKSPTLPDYSGGPLARKEEVPPHRRPDGQNLIIGQAASNRFSGPVEIIVHGKQPIRFELTENTSNFLLDSINSVKEIAAIHIEFPAA